MSTIYKNKQAKSELMQLYDEKLASLNIPYNEIDIKTQFGNTRIIQVGKPSGKPIVLLHGYNAGSPLTLEAVKELTDDYVFYAIDTIGQTTKSDETHMNIKDDSYAIWLDEVLEKLHLEQTHIIGISYGAFILQKLMVYKPQRIEKSILVVPSGIVNGNIWESLTKLTLPLIKFKIKKTDTNLKKFISAFTPKNDDFIFKLLRAIMHGVKMDTRIPTLLKKKQVEHYNKPVYVIAASNDIYFPGQQVIERCRLLFNNFQDAYILEHSNHMPGRETYPIIQSKIKEWI